MKIQGDMLKISSGALNVKGEKLEPEEQIVRREVKVDAPVQHGVGVGQGKTVGSIATSIITDQSAGDQANAMRTLCGNCLHFRNDRWLIDLAKADHPGAPIEHRRAVNKIRGALLQTANAKITNGSASAEGDLDVEHALRTLGYCQALFEFLKGAGKNNEEATTLVHPASTCPADVRGPANPDGFFQYASGEAKKAANANYDRILQIAAGKK